MRVDTINTRFGDIEVEYSTFTKGFFIKKYPERMEQISGLSLLKSRDNSFKEFSKLEEHVKELVHNALIDFEFNRKVIIYKITASCENSSSDSLYFEYLVCNESTKTIRFAGKDRALNEYYVVDSNVQRYVGKRNIFGQIVFADKEEYVFIDYSEELHDFFKLFTANFHKLKQSLKDFFEKENVVNNILNNSNSPLMLNK